MYPAQQFDQTQKFCCILRSCFCKCMNYVYLNLFFASVNTCICTWRSFLMTSIILGLAYNWLLQLIFYIFWWIFFAVYLSHFQVIFLISQSGLYSGASRDKHRQFMSLSCNIIHTGYLTGYFKGLWYTGKISYICNR